MSTTNERVSGTITIIPSDRLPMVTGAGTALYAINGPGQADMRVSLEFRHRFYGPD